MSDLTIKKVERFVVSDGAEFETIADANAYCCRVEAVLELAEELRLEDIGIRSGYEIDVARWILRRFTRKGSNAPIGENHA